jgi:hypothetical protein
VLDALNEAAKSSLTARALVAKCGDQALKDYVATGSLKPGQRAVMVNTSPRWLPKLLRMLGLDPDNAPEALAGLMGLLWAAGYLRASAALGQQIKKLEAQPPDPKPANGTPPTP